MRFMILVCYLAHGIPFALGQDAEFTQFYANPLYLNPALAGSVQCPRFVLNYRNQWPGIKDGFQTYSASYDQYVDILSGGVGFALSKDGGAAGTFNTTMANVTYAYHTAVGRKLSIGIGIKSGYMQRSVNLNELTYADQIDKTYGFVRNSSEVLGTDSRAWVDFSAGVMVYSKQVFTGVTVHHLMEPRIGLITDMKLLRRYTVCAGMHIPLDDGESQGLSVSPNLLFTSQGSFTQVNMGLYITKGIITGGLWYRKNDAMIVLIGIDDKRYKLGYSYDITVSNLGSASGGSHELSLALLLPCKVKKAKHKSEKCNSPPGSNKRRKIGRIKCPSF